LRSPTSARILIVGAGIAGLGTARALARAGFAAEVVERQRTWQEAGAGIYLPGNAARALRALDLEHAVVDKAVVITSQRVCDHRGRLLVEVEVAGLWNGVGPCLALQRADLHAVLLEGAEVPIRMDVDVRGNHHGNGPLTVDFGGGDAAEYDLVIGADGIHSSVRALAFGSDAAARPVGQVGWRFVADCPTQVTTWSVMLGHRSAFLTLPIGDGRVYCYCDVIPS
jgi:FAD-dependent urate hydroxylase